MAAPSQAKPGGLGAWRATPAAGALAVAIAIAIAIAIALALALAAAGAAALALAPNGWHAFTLLLLSPVVEETVFRAGLHEQLLRRRVQPWLANLAAASVFVAAHALVRGPDPAIVWFALPAIALGMAYDRWRSLPICIALHAAMNALWWAGGSRLIPFTP